MMKTIENTFYSPDASAPIPWRLRTYESQTGTNETIISRATRSEATLVLTFCHFTFGQLLSVRPRQYSRKMHRKPKSHMFNQITIDLVL